MTTPNAPRAKTAPKLHQRRPSPAPAFHTPSPTPNPPAPAHTPNPPTVGGPCDPGTREQGGGLPGGSGPKTPEGKGGPKTPEGKAVSARNATTHGLFCRQTVLPHLGESPDAYKELFDRLLEELPPRSLMERQYLELWADASWKLRRLSRWEAQVWEDDALDEDARLHKIERLMRLQTTLRRQLDKSVHMLGKEVPALYGTRLRERELAYMEVSEAVCRQDPFYEKVIAKSVLQQQASQEQRQGLPSDFPLDTLDTADPKNCRNEPPPPLPQQPPPSRQEAQPDIYKPFSHSVGGKVPKADRGPSSPPLLGAGGLSDAPFRV